MLNLKVSQFIEMRIQGCNTDDKRGVLSQAEGGGEVQCIAHTPYVSTHVNYQYTSLYWQIAFLTTGDHARSVGRTYGHTLLLE